MNIDPHSPDLTPELIAIAEEIGVKLRNWHCGYDKAVTANRISEDYAKRGFNSDNH